MTGFYIDIREFFRDTPTLHGAKTAAKSENVVSKLGTTSKA